MDARRVLAAAAVVLAGPVLLAVGNAGAPDAAQAEETVTQQTGMRALKGPVTSKGVRPGEATESLATDLPKPVFITTPKHIKPYAMLEKYEEKPRPAFLVAEGCRNVARGKPVTSSDSLPIIGELDYVTDGDKEAGDGSYMELAPGRQWVQVDLERRCRLYGILLWHYHGEGRVYHDVMVQVSDDPDFIEGVRTVYNNDYDNSAGLGIGRDLEYIEDYQGRLIDAGGVCGRYVRLYSAGSSSGDMNHYTEVEVHGKAVD